MDVKLAEQILATHLKEEYDFYFKNIEPLVKAANTDKSISIPQDIQEKFEELQDDTNHCGDELASYPELFDVIRCWMIDISGEGIKEIPPNLDSVDLDEFIDQYGNLAHEVLQTVRAAGFKISDMSGASNGWNIGIPCTDSEAKNICTIIHEKFKTAIELDLMAVYKRFWGHRLSTLHDWDTLQEWLKTNTLEDDED